MNNDSIYSFWLLSLKSISGNAKVKLFEYFKSAYHVFFASEADIKDCGILSEEKQYAFLKERSRANLEGEYEAFLRTGFGFVTLEDETGYPYRLKMAGDRPYGFYYNGTLPDNSKKHIAMVGSRNCTGYGKTMAYELGKALGAAGVVVVSGMALGIDTYSHSGALDGGGQTVAVLGCGADVIYPKRNALLYERISSSGCVVSEFPLSSPPRAEQFPQRNRIISGMCDATIVVEAALKSGSLITADCALEQNRDVYAVPGRVMDSLSEGCNRLITQGAGIITSVEQFVRDLSELDSGAVILDSKMKAGRSVDLTGEETLVLAALDYYPKDLNVLLSEINLSFLAIIGALSGLQTKGLIKEVFKNNYVII